MERVFYVVYVVEATKFPRRYGYILTEFNSIVQVVHQPVANDTALSSAMNNKKYTV
ncbi:MAG TPA: hypothetical protein V6D48_25035 [Oculatellaceae cyanobacterium]